MLGVSCNHLLMSCSLREQDLGNEGVKTGTPAKDQCVECSWREPCAGCADEASSPIGEMDITPRSFTCSRRGYSQFPLEELVQTP